MKRHGDQAFIHLSIQLKCDHDKIPVQDVTSPFNWMQSQHVNSNKSRERLRPFYTFLMCVIKFRNLLPIVAQLLRSASLGFDKLRHDQIALAVAWRT